jgi:hypothetical protein
MQSPIEPDTPAVQFAVDAALPVQELAGFDGEVARPSAGSTAQHPPLSESPISAGAATLSHQEPHGVSYAAVHESNSREDLLAQHNQRELRSDSESSLHPNTSQISTAQQGDISQPLPHNDSSIQGLNEVDIDSEDTTSDHVRVLW